MSRRFVLSLFAVFLVLLTISCSSTKGAVEVVKEEDAVEQVLPVSITEDGRIIVSDHVLTLLNGEGTIDADLASIAEEGNATGMITLPDASKEGYTFDGWYNITTESLLDSKTIAVSSVDKDYILIPSFSLDLSKAEYSFIEEGDEGVISFIHPAFSVKVSAPLASLPSVTVSDILKEAMDKKTITLPSLSLDEYTFLGWQEEGNSEISETFTIDLNKGGETSVKPVFSLDVSQTKVFYSINGDEITLRGELAGRKLTLKAPLSSYVIGGEEAIKKAIEEKIVSLPSLSYKGYTFDGWMDQATGKVEESVDIDIVSLSSPKAYKASFTPIVYSISYDEEGVTYIPKTETEEVEVPLPEVVEEVEEEKPFNPLEYTIEDDIVLNNPEKEGYTFIGWILEGEEPEEARGIEEIAKGTTGNLKYVSVWVPNEFSISLDPNGGKLEDAPSSFTFASPSFTLPVPEKDHYVFLGWKDGDKDPVVEYTVNTRVPRNLSLTALWAPKEYSITYNDNLVLYSPKETQVEESPEIIPENPVSYTVEDSFTLYNPTLEGYTFVGWIEEGQETYEANEVYIMAPGSFGDRKLSAVWKPNVYSIFYSLKGGEKGGEMASSFTYGASEPVIAAPVMENYVFQGWLDVDSEDGTPSFSFNTKTARDVYLVAQWKAEEFKISYNLQGGTFNGLSAARVYTVESEGFTLPLPLREGYDFVGWVDTDSKEEKTVYSASLSYGGVRSILNMWSDRIQFFASLYDEDFKSKLEEGLKEAEIDFSEENGVYSFHFDSDSFEDNLLLTMDLVEFLGMDIEAVFNDGVVILPEISIEKGETGDRHFMAVWDVIEYSLDYDEVGLIFGSDVEEVKNPLTYTVEDAFSVINPERKGHDFVGWIVEGETTKDARSVYEIAKGTTGDKSLVAVWKPSTYTLTLDFNGGEEFEYEPTFTYGGDGVTIPDPVRDNYIFLGWQNMDDPESAFIRNCRIGRFYSSSVSLTAQWQPKVYSVSYDLGGGALALGVKNPLSYTVEDQDMVLAAPTREGYVFSGWTEDPEASYRTYSLRYTLDTSRCENITLYAMWTPQEYKITYDLDGGSYRFDNSNPATYNIESNGVVLANPVKDGYEFQGWIMGGDRTETLRKGTVIAPGTIGDVKLYAIWNKVTVAVGVATRMQIDALEYGKNNIPRPDWVVKVPEEAGVHYEKAYSVEADLFSALLDGREKCSALMAAWAGTTYERADKTVDGTTYATSGIEYSTLVSMPELVEYWQDSNGGTWVLMKIDLDSLSIR